jgi:hypothetical protein
VRRLLHPHDPVAAGAVVELGSDLERLVAEATPAAAVREVDQVADLPSKAEAGRETLRDKLARKLEEHADEVVDAYLQGIRSDDAHQAYKAAEAWLVSGARPADADRRDDIIGRRLHCRVVAGAW